MAHRDAEVEVVEWSEQALARGDGAAGAVRGRLLVVRALAATVFGDFGAARSLLAGGRPLVPDDAAHAHDHALAAATDAYVAMADDPAQASSVIGEASSRLAAVGDELGRAYMEVTAGHRALHLEDLEAAARHYGAAVASAERLGDDAMRGRALSLLGLSLLARGDVERALRAVVDGARTNRRGNQPTSMAYSLDGLAAVALASGQPAVGAQALAAGATVRRHAGHPPSPAFVPLLDDLAARSRAQLGEAAYRAASAEAQQWHVVEALDRALDRLPEPAA